MKRISLGETIGILANIGVLGGMLLLVFELRQNNELMGAQARFNRLSINVDQYSSRIADPDLVEVLLKSGRKEQLTPVEEDIVYQYAGRALLIREWTYKELPENEIPVERWRENSQDLDAHRVVFERWKDDLDPNFVRFMEENVFD